MRSKALKVLIVILIVAVFLLLNWFGGRHVRNAFYVIASPINKICWKAGEGVADFFGTIFKMSALGEEHKALQQQNLTLIRELSTLKTLREENKALREALNLEFEEPFELFITEVIAEEKEQNALLITGGKTKGVVKDMPVITQAGVLVGRVEESFSDFSKVLLITSPEHVFDVVIGEGTGVLGVAKGKGNLGIELQLVPQEKQLKVGDVVLTTTLGGGFPKGLLVGKVKKVQKSAPEPFQGGEIDPYFTKVSLQRLFVIINFEGFGPGH